jgi:hypothetical protein
MPRVGTDTSGEAMGLQQLPDESLYIMNGASWHCKTNLVLFQLKL